MPLLPPHYSLGTTFSHTSRELWQTSENGTFVLCDGSTAPKGEDPKCSFQFEFTEGSISDHTGYYGIHENVRAASSHSSTCNTGPTSVFVCIPCPARKVAARCVYIAAPHPTHDSFI